MGNEASIVMQLVDVWKAYRVGDIVTWALRGVNLSILRGEFIAIMGPSGSGKTTLLNIIGLLDRPKSISSFLRFETYLEIEDCEIPNNSEIFNWLYPYSKYSIFTILCLIAGTTYLLAKSNTPTLINITHQILHDLPIYNLTTAKTRIQDSLAIPRFSHLNTQDTGFWDSHEHFKQVQAYRLRSGEGETK